MQKPGKILATTIGDTMENDTTCSLDHSSSSTSSGSSASGSVLSLTMPPIIAAPDHNQPTQTQSNHDDPPKKKTKFPSSKYKGVVPQANGRWGAQLYHGHKRIWLGTFDRQDQAARAHDLAAIRFRGVHAAVNFSAQHYVSRPLHVEFLTSHSMVQVVGMLRTHTYQDELGRFMRARLAANRMKKRQSQGQVPDPDPATRDLIFEKTLTASDVGKGTLHRLVIPKCHAERDLPTLTCEKGMILTFEDEGGERMWRFKYCYWKGSKNYVLTKGWSHFVKEKGLKAGDVVKFYRSVGPDKRLYIDSSLSSSSSSSLRLPPLVDGASPSSDCRSGSSDLSHGSGSGANIVRLFGVDIKVGRGG